MRGWQTTELSPNLRAIVAEFDNEETRPEGFPEARAERWPDATGD
jgi:hypothetical protein